MKKKNPKVKAFSRKDTLYFTAKNMKLEIKGKISLSRFIEFFTEIFAEVVIAQHTIKNKRRIKNIKNFMRLN